VAGDDGRAPGPDDLIVPLPPDAVAWRRARHGEPYTVMKVEAHEMLWNCSTENKLGPTPLPWVFGGVFGGKPACIEAADGRSGTTYRRC
jgi:hypothetical protein